MRSTAPSPSPVRATLASRALLAAALLAGCGRTDPDGGGADAAEIQTVAEAAARAVAFDTEGELTALLDDDYLAADTDLLDADDVTAIATDVATTVSEAVTLEVLADPATEDALRDQLDDVYLAFDTTILDVGDVEQTARDACFDVEAELTAVLDDEYLPITFVPDFGDLTGVPADLADGDDDTVQTATLPLEITANNIALDTAGCVNGEALVFAGGSFSCQTPTVSPAGTTAVGAATANTRPFEALPIVMKAEFNNVTIAAAGGTNDVIVYNAANPPPRSFIIIDAWAVATNVTGAPTWHLREGGANDLTTTVDLGVSTTVSRVANFQNQGQRSVAAGDTLAVRMTADADGADNATFTVYILGLPI